MVTLSRRSLQTLLRLLARVYTCGLWLIVTTLDTIPPGALELVLWSLWVWIWLPGFQRNIQLWDQLCPEPNFLPWGVEWKQLKVIGANLEWWVYLLRAQDTFMVIPCLWYKIPHDLSLWWGRNRIAYAIILWGKQWQKRNSSLVKFPHLIIYLNYLQNNYGKKRLNLVKGILCDIIDHDQDGWNLLSFCGFDAMLSNWILWVSNLRLL